MVADDQNGANLLLEQLDWLTAVGCAAHDMGNGIKWGLQYHLCDGTSKDLFIVIESLRNCILEISQYSIEFLYAKVAFSDAQDPVEVQEFWLAMGVEPEWLDLFTAIDPIWKDGRLHINKEVENDPGLGEKLRSMYMYVLKWKTCSGSR